MTEDDKLKRGPEVITCPTCKQPSVRQGAQDFCDVYVCENNHLTRIKVGANRDEKLDSAGSGTT